MSVENAFTLFSQNQESVGYFFLSEMGRPYCYLMFQTLNLASKATKKTEGKSSTGWRIIGYGDDDDSENESESEEGEIKGADSAKLTKKETLPQKKSRENDEAVDNYAEMLLEGKMSPVYIFSLLELTV